MDAPGRSPAPPAHVLVERASGDGDPSGPAGRLGRLTFGHRPDGWTFRVLRLRRISSRDSGFVISNSGCLTAASALIAPAGF